MKRLLSILFIVVSFQLYCTLEQQVPDDTDQPAGGAANPPYVTAIYPATAGTFREGDSVIAITFSDYMDASSLNATNVKVVNTTTGDIISGIQMTYDANVRRLYLQKDHWAGSCEYLITLSSDGVRNRYGTPLDGNRNRRLEGSPYDDFLATFHVNGNTGRMVATVPPRIWRIRPDTVRIDSALPTIMADFTVPMDTTTLREGNTLKNFRLIRTSTGATVPLTITVFSGFTIGVRPSDSLRFGETYRVVLTSNQIKANYPQRTPEYLKVLDGDNDGPEASEPDFTWHFLVDTAQAPEIDATSLLARGLRIDFTRLMDTTSLTPANIQVYDRDGYVPGTLRTTVVPFSDPLQTRVEYYFGRPTGNSFRLLISHRVRDRRGTGLEVNGNGIGGESGRPPLGDDYEEELP